MTLMEHATRELGLMGYDVHNTEDDPNNWMVKDILELIETFAKQGHSGGSAPYCVDVFTRLASYKLLTPLTGEESEWNAVGNGLFQNNRFSAVFKNGDRVYNMEGKIFRNANGLCYVNRDSSVDITFPYMPTDPVYVDVVDDDEQGGSGG